MKKRIVCILTAAALALSLCGCTVEELLDRLMGKVDLSVEEEMRSAEDGVRDSIESQAGGNIIWFRYEDFDGNGGDEAFAFVGTASSAYYEGTMWFANSDYSVELTESSKWDVPSFVSAGGGSFMLLNEHETGVTYVFGIDDGKVFESPVSGKFTNLKSDGGNDFTAEFTSYDYYIDEEKSQGEEPTTKIYWFYVENGEFREYGADTGLHRADLRAYPKGGEIMDEIYSSGLTKELLDRYYPDASEELLDQIADDAGFFEKIMKRGNGIINLNFHGAFEDRFYITLKIEGNDLSVIDCGRGWYLAAAVESIATYNVPGEASEQQ